MKNGFFYEFNCIENGEWISEKVTLEDRLVQDLRRYWNLRYNLERRWIQRHLLGDAAAIWRFKRQQREKDVESSFANFGHTVVIGNLRPISIKTWKVGIYRT